MDHFGEFWSQIDCFKVDTLEKAKLHELKMYLMENEQDKSDTQKEKMPRVGVLQKIESVMEDILQSIHSQQPPCITYSNRTKWQNVTFDTALGCRLSDNSTQTNVRFDSIHSVNKLALTMKTLSLIYELVQTGRYCTKRDLYYQNPNMFGSQSYLDDIVQNICCMFKVPRWQLNILASSKGYVAGDLQFTEYDGNYVDCRTATNGVLVPSHVVGIKHLYSNAKVVIVIEKDATFQKLLDDGILSKLAPCIIITGKGVPDVNTRLLVKKLWDTFHIPTMMLVDADPHGIEIMTVYKYGSLSMSFDAQNLAVPSVQWLGVLPSDINRLNIPDDVLLPLKKSDLDKIRDLLKRPYMNHQPTWKSEIELMLKIGKKAEIQSLVAKSSTFLTDVYLPNKIRFGGWI